MGTRTTRLTSRVWTLRLKAPIQTRIEEGAVSTLAERSSRAACTIQPPSITAPALWVVVWERKKPGEA